MLRVVYITKRDGFDSKVMFAKTGMSVTPLQNKDVITYASVISRCSSLLALRPGSPSCSLT